MTPSPRRYRQNADTRVSRAHSDFVRRHECVLYGNPLSECDIVHPIQAAHFRSAANSGTGMKPGPEYLLPLCRNHHTEQHSIGQKAFEERYGISMRQKALAYATESPDRAVKARARNILASDANAAAE
jgi:Putative HNHc nuclease